MDDNFASGVNAGNIKVIQDIPNYKKLLLANVPLQN